MTLEELQDMTWDEIARMNKEEIKKAVQIASKATKRRLDVINKNDVYSVAAEQLQKKIEKEEDLLSSRGKNTNELRKSLSAMLKFLNSRTGSYRGAKEYEKEVLERVFEKKPGESKKKYKERIKKIKSDINMKSFWDLYDRILELRPDLLYKSSYGSDRIQQLIGEELEENKKLTSEDVEELIKRMKEKVEGVEEISEYKENTDSGDNKTYTLPKKIESGDFDGFFTRK